MAYPSEKLMRKVQEIMHRPDFLITNVQAKVEKTFGKPEYVVESPFHVQNFLQEAEPKDAEFLHKEMCTNQHPPVFFYLYDGGKNVQVTTCELFEGECGWCIGDDGSWAAECRARIDTWLDSVHSSSASDFIPMKGRFSKRQVLQFDDDELDVLDGEQIFRPNWPLEYSPWDPVPHVAVNDSASMSPHNPLYDDDDDDDDDEYEYEDEYEDESEEEEKAEEEQEAEVAQQQFEREEHPRDIAEREKQEWLLLELERHIIISRQQEIEQGGRKNYAPKLNEFCELPEPFPAPCSSDAMVDGAIWSENLFSDGTPQSSGYAASVASTIPEDLEIIASWENTEVPRRPIPIRYIKRQSPLMQPIPVSGTGKRIPFLETPMEDYTPREEDIMAEWTRPNFVKFDAIEPFPAPGTIPPYAPFLDIPVEQMILCEEDIGGIWINDRCEVGAEQWGAEYRTVHA